MAEPTELSVTLNPKCTCPCTLCCDDEHFRCHNQRCEVGPVARAGTVGPG